MIKRASIILFVVLVMTCTICSACSKASVDYPDVSVFEAELNAGKDLTGKTVTFTVDEFVPQSAFGYNMQAGEHLNFCSSKNPNVKAGDTITVKVTEVSSMLGSYIIYYEIVD